MHLEKRCGGRSANVDAIDVNIVIADLKRSARVFCRGIIASRRISNGQVMEGAGSFGAVMCDIQRLWQSARSKAG